MPLFDLGLPMPCLFSHAAFAFRRRLDVSCLYFGVSRHEKEVPTHPPSTPQHVVSLSHAMQNNAKCMSLFVLVSVGACSRVILRMSLPLPAHALSLMPVVFTAAMSV